PNLNRSRYGLNEVFSHLSHDSVQTYGVLGNPTYLNRMKFHDKYFVPVPKLPDHMFCKNRTPYRRYKAILYDKVILTTATLFQRVRLTLPTHPLIFQAQQSELIPLYRIGAYGLNHEYHVRK